MNGLRIEHIQLGTSAPYEFRSVGSAHYIALHDLALRDGEVTVEGLAPVRGRDLRDTLTYVPQGRAISGWAAPVDRDNSFTVLTFEPALISEALGERYRREAPGPLVYARDPALLQSMTKLRRVARSEHPDRLYAETLSLAVALEIFGAVESEHRGRLSAQQVRRLTDFIDARLGGSLTLGDLAGAVGLSGSHFSRTFTATFGRGPHQFTQERRIARAVELLRHSAKELDEIASLTGFETPSSFRRNFKRVTGQTPSSYRRNN
ncbi:AraC family transcriptional regulator [Sphingomonas glaciei]|uniref:AraC family transcriptional regulator n=1 Tax=Sphingomonas glaciei TaxID=2938948 RepID=A0ABY5N0F3_9SPHN|nr:AraC family transcriptional regulator [Sphingomonas glaciei]UUR09510.1 AraC family transcriptional regulator [Sphingomonas glaciei]